MLLFKHSPLFLYHSAADISVFFQSALSVSVTFLLEQPKMVHDLHIMMPSSS